MRFRFSFFSLITVLAFALSSCAGDFASGLNPRPSAFGKINSLFVIADDDVWAAGASDSIAFFFEAPYLILPQPEPIFDVRHITPREIAEQPTLQELRNYIVLADLSNEDSPTTQMVLSDLNDARVQQVREEGFGSAVARNKWATNQQLIYLLGKNHNELLTGLSTAYPAVVKRIDERENERIKTTAYFPGVNRSLGREIQARSGALMDIPGNYERVPVEAENFAWVRKNVKGGSLNIMATKIPYDSPDQLSKEGLKAIRDRVGKEYFGSSLDSTWMKINDTDLPLFVTPTEINGKYSLEGRGIWEMENDFLAGPFISYLINDEDDRQLVLIDGFVLAPGRKKREFMEELTQVLRTAEVQ